MPIKEKREIIRRIGQGKSLNFTEDLTSVKGKKERSRIGNAEASVIMQTRYMFNYLMGAVEQRLPIRGITHLATMSKLLYL